MIFFNKNKKSAGEAQEQENEVRGQPAEFGGPADGPEKVKNGFSFFSRNRKKKEKARAAGPAAAEAGGAEAGSYVEKMFAAPYIQCIPDGWCRSYLVDRVASLIRRQSTQVLTVLAAIFAVVAAASAGSLLLSSYTDKRITSYLKDTNTVLENYSDEIKSAVSLGGVLAFVHDVPVHEQYMGIVKTLAESGVVAHQAKFCHNQNEVPNNVKNNFEAQNALKFDGVQTTGIWLIDCSYLNSGAERGGEQWILEANRKFQALFKPYGANVYVDMSTKNYSATREELNRGELVVVFWK